MKNILGIFKAIRVFGVPASLSITFVFAILLAGCGKLELNSHWRSRLVIIDGLNSEWEGAGTYLEDENAFIGLVNDEEYMYVCLASTNREIQTQMMRRGFTLWFDPDGGKKRLFGIRFPLGMQEMGVPMRGRGSERDLEELRQSFEESMAELEILGPGKDECRRLQVADAEGIFVKVRTLRGGFVYELKVPLAQSEQHPFAIGAEAGNTIGLGLETREINRDMFRERVGGGMRGGGGLRGGRGGRGGSRGSGMPRGGTRPEMPKSLKIWATVQLVSADASSADKPGNKVATK